MKRPDDSIPAVLFCFKRQERREESRMYLVYAVRGCKGPLTRVQRVVTSQAMSQMRLLGQRSSRGSFYLPPSSFYYYLNWIECQNPGNTRVFCCCCIMTRMSNVTVFTGGWGGCGGSLRQDCLTAPCHILSSEVPPLTC